MTKQKRRTPKASSDPQSEPSGSEAPLPPLKPRPIVHIVLWIILILWLAALVVMRLKTVHRTESPAAAPNPPPIQMPAK